VSNDIEIAIFWELKQCKFGRCDQRLGGIYCRFLGNVSTYLPNYMASPEHCNRNMPREAQITEHNIGIKKNVFFYLRIVK
jgi:hypothetical protein